MASTASRLGKPVLAKNGKPLTIAGQTIIHGTVHDLHLDYSQSYTGIDVHVPVRVVASPKPGPIVFFTGVVHGDELNGLGIIRELVFDNELPLKRGVVIAVPVVNILGMDSHQRYLPDRRDPNRCFPGSAKGSLTGRLTNLVYTEIIKKSDYGVDLHTAAIRRTNYPNIRADLDDPRVADLARSTGLDLIVHGKGPSGSLRREACKRKIPTIVIEAGEVSKIEPGIVELVTRGSRNLLRHLKMVTTRAIRTEKQLEVRKSVWIRAEYGGILKYHARPGDVVKKGQLLATNQNIFGKVQNELYAPDDGIIQGCTTMPAVKPGEPVFHLALPGFQYEELAKNFGARNRDPLHRKVRRELATSLTLETT